MIESEQSIILLGSILSGSPKLSQKAECASLPPDKFDELFYYDLPNGSSIKGKAITETAAKAKKLCAGCPVIFDCRTHALQNNITTGIWGGLTYNERRIIKRNKKSGK